MLNFIKLKIRTNSRLNDALTPPLLQELIFSYYTPEHYKCQAILAFLFISYSYH